MGERIDDVVLTTSRDSVTNEPEFDKSTNGAKHTETQAGSIWAYGNYPNTLYLNDTSTGAAQTNNTVIYTSNDVSIYNTHSIENTSTTDPVDVYVSVDGTNYATLAASVSLHDDVTTGGGVKVVTIPAGKIGVLTGKFRKIQVLKDGATAETPSIRYSHTVI